MEVWPGQPFPLGASYDGAGTNFSLFSETAERVEVCLFDDAGEETRLRLPETTAFCSHGYLPGVGPGQRYGFRVDGPFDPARGLRCNPAKLLIDPYAKALAGQVQWDAAVYPYPLGGAEETRDDADSGQYMPKAVVTSPYFDWRGDFARAGRGTRPSSTRCTSRASRRAIPAFRHSCEAPTPASRTRRRSSTCTHLGVTAVELMPVHQFVSDHHLVEQGLANYWGYNSIGLLRARTPPIPRAGSHASCDEFKEMVRTLHAAGIEVILDVVYNHTAEGNHLGPMLSLQGDRQPGVLPAWSDETPRFYFDTRAPATR